MPPTDNCKEQDHEYRGHLSLSAARGADRGRHRRVGLRSLFFGVRLLLWLLGAIGAVALLLVIYLTTIGPGEEQAAFVPFAALTGLVFPAIFGAIMGGVAGRALGGRAGRR
ncbi:hypothetical protein ACFOHS_11780 [Jhaorihella thermophila]